MKSIPKAVIVDDEKDLCFLLEKILSHMYFDTTSLNSIGDAQNLLPVLKPSVIFLDNQLPDGYGIHLIPNIKKALPDTAIVVMTAYNSDTDELEAIKYGADVFLKKTLVDAHDQIGPSYHWIVSCGVDWCLFSPSG